MHINTSQQNPLNLGSGNHSCNWEVHIAGLDENAKEKDEIPFGFLNQRCMDGDLQVYLSPVKSPEKWIRKNT